MLGQLRRLSGANFFGKKGLTIAHPALLYNNELIPAHSETVSADNQQEGWTMYYTGFADEASSSMAGQIAATKELGWQFIEARAVDGTNIHDISDEAFDKVVEQLDAAGIRINCFGSAVANWGWDPMSDEDFEKTTAQLRRALVRMKRVNCTMLRGMSFKATWDRPAFDPAVEEQVFRKVNVLVRMCEEAGVLYLHENCNNYGGMSWKHTLKLLDHVKSPNFKLVFDTGNPVMNFDRSNGDELVHCQNSWEFYQHVREFIYYVHIKDGVFQGRNENGGFHRAHFTFPGEGEGDVMKIVIDLLRHGYDGGFSMEPHMKVVFHDADAKSEDAARIANYVEYGRRFMRLVESARESLGQNK